MNKKRGAENSPKNFAIYEGFLRLEWCTDT